MNYVR